MPQTDPSTKLLATLLDAAVDAVIIADAEGRMIRVNQAACALFGYERDEMAGAKLDMLMPDTYAIRHSDAVRHHIKTGETRIIGKGRDLEGLRKDGSIFPLHLSVGRSTIDGEPMFVGIMHDLTRRKAMEEALVVAQRMEALGQLTGGVAHDFNNLLTVIVGNLELLEASLEEERDRSLIHEALGAAELGSSLIGKLLALGRRSHLKPERLDVNEAVRSTLSILGRTLGPNIRVSTSLAEDIWIVEADDAQLQTALINLAINAQDAMLEGGNIVIRTSNVMIDDNFVAHEIDLARGNYVRISVTDNGSGMTADVVRRAFEPFFTTKAAAKGTGLGLSMVYGFARQSGGHATLYSEAGLGTTASLYFPAVGGSSKGSGSPEGAQGDVAVEPGSGETILVVEDDAAIRRLSVARLEAMGYRVVEAANADEALAVLVRHPETAALFADIVMPGEMNGIDLARRVRTEHPEIAILLTSGFSGDLIHPQNGFTTSFQLLNKPYRQSELANRLRILLSGRADLTG
ncbi:PAS domain S-box protein [Albidovulum aquaemixtae]|nr:PAS domain S-box protein [Defluviimonas aquaemixtae]